MELDAVVSMEFRGTFPLISMKTEIDVLIPQEYAMEIFPWKSMEFHGGYLTGLSGQSVFSNQLNSTNKTIFWH